MAAVQFKPATYSNWQTLDLGSTVCNYISLQEMTKAKSRPYLQFMTEYFNGSDRQIRVMINSSEYNYSISSYPTSSGSNYVTNGVHWRGCGGISYDAFIKLHRSAMNSDIFCLCSSVIFQSAMHPPLTPAYRTAAAPLAGDPAHHE